MRFKKNRDELKVNGDQKSRDIFWIGWKTKSRPSGRGKWHCRPEGQHAPEVDAGKIIRKSAATVGNTRVYILLAVLDVYTRIYIYITNRKSFASNQNQYVSFYSVTHADFSLSVSFRFLFPSHAHSIRAVRPRANVPPASASFRLQNSRVVRVLCATSKKKNTHVRVYCCCPRDPYVFRRSTINTRRYAYACYVYFDDFFCPDQVRNGRNGRAGNIPMGRSNRSIRGPFRMRFSFLFTCWFVITDCNCRYTARC